MVLKAQQAHKMEASWEGPFTVQERLGTVNYLIAFPNSSLKPKVYHVNSLKPFYSRDLQVCQFTVQGDEAEWPDGVYYDGKKDGGVEEVNLSTTLERLQRRQIKELCTSFAPLFSATPGRTERAYHSIDTDSWPEHLLHLEKVFERIRQAGLTVKAKKCQIGQNRVTYLGHQVGRGTINPLQAKVDAIQKWPVPRSKKQVQSFLGLAGYYRRFVPHYSQIAAPLTDLTKKTQPNAVK
ncbi:uncharacterized protein LOC127034293 [Gopherus flavomarginatus]|uniref:uncharacterized protein LOC127034293 n=1 Tax=Gopherus flavomarginatus TaxID=286002 RepID=UPI0021CB9ECA|nr:uncharacterized protein LOC127034293 [Gopherus flavomarginatus]